MALLTYYHNGFQKKSLSCKFLESLFQGKSYKISNFNSYYLYTNLNQPKNFVIYKKTTKFQTIPIYEKPKIINYAFIIQNFKLYYDAFLYFLTRNEIKSFYNPLPIITDTYFYENANFYLSLEKDLIPYLNIQINKINLIVPEKKYGIDFINGNIPLDVYTDLLKQSDLITHIQKEPL